MAAASPERRAVSWTRLVALLAVVALLALALLWRAGPPPDPRATGVQLDLPPQLTAGGSVQVGVTGTIDGVATLIVATSAGTTIRQVGVVDGVGGLPIGPPVTDVTGLLSVSVAGHEGAAGQSVTAVSTIEPGPPVGEIAALLGPRSVVVDRERLMVVAVPRDAAGNTVAAGTDVRITVERPDGAVEQTVTQTDGMVAWVWVPASQVAGSARAAVLAGTALGPDVRFRQVPDVPQSVEVILERRQAQADGTRTVRARTQPLVDRFGNVVADGTSALFELRGPDGITSVPSIVAGGIVRADLPLTGAPGPRDVVAHVAGVTSEPVRVDVTAATDHIPITREQLTPGRDALRIGPVADPLGALLPDGTAVQVRGSGFLDDAQLRYGSVSVEVPRDLPVTVSIAGAEAEA